MSVMHCTREGWPDPVPVPVPVEQRPYVKHQSELSIEAGCLFWGTRVIVPASLHTSVLEELHTSHQVRMKGLAQSYIWWPGLNEELNAKLVIVKLAKAIVNSQHEFLCILGLTTEPWEQIHIDFAGPFFMPRFDSR